MWLLSLRSGTCDGLGWLEMLLATTSSSSSSIYICKVPPEWLPWTRRALERIRPSEMVWDLLSQDTHMQISTCKAN